MTSPVSDISILLSFDKLIFALLPPLGGTLHVSAIVFPHDPVFDQVGNSHYNVRMNTAETILFEQFTNVAVKVIEVGFLGGLIHEVEDVVENSLIVSSVILDHVFDSHHDLVVSWHGDIGMVS